MLNIRYLNKSENKTEEKLQYVSEFYVFTLQKN